MAKESRLNKEKKRKFYIFYIFINGDKVTIYYDKKEINKFILDKTPKSREIIVGIVLIFAGILFIIGEISFNEKEDSLIERILVIISSLVGGPA